MADIWRAVPSTSEPLLFQLTPSSDAGASLPPVVVSRPSSVDTTASTTGADDEEDGEDGIDDDLKLLDVSAMSSGGHAKTPTATSTTPQELAEEHDAFQTEQSPQPRSLPLHRPVPVLHHFSFTPPNGAKTSSDSFLFPTHGGRPLPSPQTPTQPQSLQLMPTTTTQRDDNGKGGKAGSAAVAVATVSGNMPRSISDSTLRRAALHLNLNQAVLPSFTSLQQFKVAISIGS